LKVNGTAVIYTLLGFVFLPWFAEQQMVKILDQRLSLNSQVESIYFNPFSFFFEVEGLAITETDGSDLITLENLHLNFQASQMVLLKFQFSEIALSGFDVFFQRNTITDNNIQRLSERWASTSEPATEEPTESESESETESERESEEGELIPVEITIVDIADLTLHILDEVPVTPFETSVTLAAATIEDFSTLAGALANNSIAINFEQDASINWTGDFSVNPLVFTGDITLDNFGLSAASRYLQDSVPFAI